MIGFHKQRNPPHMHKPPIDAANDRRAWAMLKTIRPNRLGYQVRMYRIKQGEGRNGEKLRRRNGEALGRRAAFGGLTAHHESREYRAEQAFWDRHAADIRRQGNIKLPPDARTLRGMRCFDRSYLL